ncbi:MAG: hypothetical protein K0S47_1256 [Herbinix sp.]|jgi:glucan-binding YG repeat protein|nr:hypothetical protein [Herbinix sp.]
MENKTTALVLEVNDQTALLLGRGGHLVRVPNLSHYQIGDEIEYQQEATINNKISPLGYERYRWRWIKVAACFIILISGIFTSNVIPVKSAQIFDCIEVKTNIYGTVVSAKGMNTTGDEILKVIENEAEIFANNTVAEYTSKVKEIMAGMEANSPISELAETEAFDQYYNSASDELKNEMVDALENEDEQAVNQIGQRLKDEIVAELYTIPEKELQLAKELFGFEKVRTEYYNVDSGGHDSFECTSDQGDAIYISFWGINMQTSMWSENSMALFFYYKSVEEIADFNNSTVYLYDLTTNEEVSSERLEGNQNEFFGTSSRYEIDVFIKTDNMIPYHSYYIKLNNVFYQNEEINNIFYVFNYVPEGSMGFTYDPNQGEIIEEN